MGDTGTHMLALQRLTFGSAGTGRKAAGQGRVVGGVGLIGQLGQPYIPTEQGGRYLYMACGQVYLGSTSLKHLLWRQIWLASSGMMLLS